MACSLVPAAFFTHLISDGGVKSTAERSRSAAARPGSAATRAARTARKESRRMPLIPSPVEGGNSVRRDFLPARVRVEELHLLRQRRRVGPEVLLIDDAVMVHHEGHHAGGAVLRGEGDHAEAADHVSVGHVVRGAAGRIRPLPGQDPVVVAVVRNRPLLRAFPVTLGPCLGHERSERALWLTGLGLPVESVTLAGRAGEALGVLEHLTLLACLGVVLALRIDVSEAYLDRAELVPPDAPVEDLFFSLGRVEAPARSVGHHGNGEGVVVAAHVEDDLPAARLEAVALVVFAYESLAASGVGDLVARGEQGTTPGAKHFAELLLVVLAKGVDEGLYGLLRSLEVFLPGRRRSRTGGGAAHQQDEHGQDHRERTASRRGIANGLTIRLSHVLLHSRPAPAHRRPPPRPPPPPPPPRPPPPPPPPPPPRPPPPPPPPPPRWKLPPPPPPRWKPPPPPLRWKL